MAKNNGLIHVIKCCSMRMGVTLEVHVGQATFMQYIQSFWFCFLGVFLLLFTVHKRSCSKVMFLHLSVILFTGGDLCPGRSLCRGGVSFQVGSLSRGGEGFSVVVTPRTVEERAVRILLESILLYFYFLFSLEIISSSS